MFRKPQLLLQVFGSSETSSLEYLDKDHLCCLSKPLGQFLVVNLSGLKALPLCKDQVSCLATQPEHHLLALGLLTPRIKIYHCLILLHELVVFGPSLVEEERLLGGCRKLAFGPLPHMLACLYVGKNEPTLFDTLSGRRTTSGSATTTTCQKETSLGPDVMEWVKFNLFYMNHRELCKESFSLHSRQVSLYRNDWARFSLVNPDSVSVLDVEGTPTFGCFQVSHEYLSKYGALHTVAGEEDSKLAVASPGGGFCIWVNKRWRRFQNETLEERIKVHRMVWIPQTWVLCVLCGQYEWHVFDLNEKRLDLPPVFVSRSFSEPPRCVDFCSPKCMIALFPTRIQVYSISLEFALVESHSFIIPPDMIHMTLVLSKTPSSLLLPRVVLINSQGKCLVMDLENPEDCFPLNNALNKVSDAWVKSDPLLGVLVWTVVEFGLKLWVPSLDPLGEIYREGGVDLGHSEVGSLPVGNHEDALICFQAHSNLVLASKSPILHGVLGWLLRQHRDGLARRVLAETHRHKSTPLVCAALEDLLQGALLGENQLEVSKVVSVLGCVPFEMMSAVVARCARQIDPELWDVLFSVVGQPKDLFNQCLVMSDSHKHVMQRRQLILIAAELLPLVDADREDPPDGPVRRANAVLARCEPGGKLEREVYEYAEKRGLQLNNNPLQEVEESTTPGFFLSFFLG